MNTSLTYSASMLAATCLVASAGAFGAGVAGSATVGSPAMGPPSPRVEAASDAPTDTAITAQIKARLAREDSLKQSDISVTTAYGRVTLDGSASSSRAKSVAGIVTKSVIGVKAVDNNLTAPSSNAMLAKAHETMTNTERVMADSWITTKVKSTILGDSISKGFDVQVVTLHGVVSLSGVLSSQGAVDHLKDIVRKVKGVKGLNTATLTVAGV
ncbi:BON domain-containing protein (plasmid) [Burkholderia sp. FERM BP-3421]|uniref:BON domain-containing protein n=1 Tax=Burkholderia sp. FERM BP-3421 TaxID=1494466 RepID=UPI00235EADA0|nr:BON domain-containing protein [Burkholderia sp. FERM BP-3421]WDD90382.1 BON domain-containing protein [Burkholderia sp. FERM BP-3421]